MASAGKIEDPYWRDTETSQDWVHECEWLAETSFYLDELKPGLWTLRFDSIDCMAEAQLNGHLIGHCDNQFIRWDFDVGTLLQLKLELDSPRLWWPAGYGAQEMYDVAVLLGEDVRHYRIGLREVQLITDADEIGSRFAFRINGKEIFMRGASWIPADALPARATPEVVDDLLQSALDANMNMLRVWGGGQYEPDWFYQMCSEKGLMIWQDFMFSCNLYPASDSV